MPSLSVILLQPRIEGNVGAIARSMANFGLSELVLVNPCPLGDEAYRRAKHGSHILEGARLRETLEDALEEVDLSVGSTGVTTLSEKAFHRHTLTPWELRERLGDFVGRVGLVLGREDYGLRNDELSRLDLVANVPCSPDYPIMNISHAATVLLYELSRASPPPSGPPNRLASGFERERLMGAFGEFLKTTRYPSHRSRRTEVMFRRLLGRALPTKWEFHALMGALRRATQTVRRMEESSGSGPSSPRGSHLAAIPTARRGHEGR